MHDVGKRRDQSRLAEPRHAFQQDMAICEQRHDHALDDVVVADNHLRDFLFYLGE
jgi:hypothetical protein